MLKSKVKRYVRATRGYLHNRQLIRKKGSAPPVSQVDTKRLSKCKVIFAAIDALSWDILWPLIKKGKMPNLARLIDNGTYGPLKTLFPALSPELWNSIGTGKLPAKHGIVGFMTEDRQSGRSVPYTSNMRKCKTIWEILGDYGKTASVVGWWNTWPAEPVNGAMVSGILGYKEKDLTKKKGQDHHAEMTRKGRLRAGSFNKQTYPEGLFQEVEGVIRPPDEIGDAEPFIKDLWECSAGFSKSEKDVLRLITNVYNGDRTYVEIAKYLNEKLCPDFLTFYMAGVDVIGHKYWAYMEPHRFSVEVQEDKIAIYKDVILNYYMYVDQVIGEFSALMDDNTVMAVISDHGMSPDDRRFKKTGVNSGRHINEDGVFVFSGKHIRKCHQIEGNSILDITPTLLALFGLPSGDDMDGSVMSEIFEDGFFDTYPIYFFDGYDTGREFDLSPIESPVDEEIADRLRSLGYIE